MTNWKNEILKLLGENETIVFCSHPLDGPEMTRDFDDGYRGIGGCAFIAFSEKNVYFPICFDGSEWVGRAPRFFPAEPLGHQGF